MMFWLAAAFLTFAASLAVLLPLARRGGDEPGRAAFDIEVYRDQLAELERDAASGLIAEEEAGHARAEIGRRILKASAQARAGMHPAGHERRARLAGAVAVLAVPLVGWGVYAAIGSPDVPGQPLQERLARDPAESPVEELVARAEAHLGANPDDGRGWDVLGPVYLRMGRAEDSVIAYRNAVRLLGPTPERESGLGEAIAAAAGGMISAEAQAAFERALALDGEDPKARFYLATALAQEERLEDALAGWRALLSDLPEDSPWRVPAEQASAEAERRLAITPGPDEADIEAAEAMSAQERAEMVETMVASLDRRLRDDPSDVEGWRRLIRSYLVLERRGEAEDALARATEALGADSAAAEEIAAFAAGLGLAPTQ